MHPFVKRFLDSTRAGRNCSGRGVMPIFAWISREARHPVTRQDEYSGDFSTSAALIRLRTAHAGLQWENTSAYFSLDRPIFTPDAPTSLTALAEPPLAWSGNLWTWNPQLGVTRRFHSGGLPDVKAEAALVDVGDAPLTPQFSYSATPPSSAEQSRWPGVEARVAMLGNERETERSHFGLGGFFAPHNSSLGQGFDSWAATADARLFLPARMEFTGSGYRGAALGGLGGGAFKDIAYSLNPITGESYLVPLDDAGGWAQLKERISERLEATQHSAWTTHLPESCCALLQPEGRSTRTWREIARSPAILSTVRARSCCSRSNTGAWIASLFWRLRQRAM